MGREPDVILLGGTDRGDPEVQVSGRHDPEAFVEIGSVTKPFTAALLRSLVAAGTVTLDDPVSSHLEVGPGPVPTLRHLVEHTSGLPRVPPGVHGWRREPYARIDEAAFAGLVRDLPDHLRGAPGAVREYSNFGYAVLGAALSAAAGQSWFEAVVSRVVEPLDLPDAVLLEHDVPASRRLVALDRRGRPRATWTLGPFAPAGGLWTTPRVLGELARKVLLEDAWGTRPLGWQHTDGVDWHNGATRDAAVFVGAARSRGNWTVCHGFHRPAVQIDGMGLRSLDKEHT